MKSFNWVYVLMLVFEAVLYSPYQSVFMPTADVQNDVLNFDIYKRTMASNEVSDIDNIKQGTIDYTLQIYKMKLAWSSSIFVLWWRFKYLIGKEEHPYILRQIVHRSWWKLKYIFFLFYFWNETLNNSWQKNFIYKHLMDGSLFKSQL